ncbi:unnamed protein product [Ixodes pacificus]
MHFYEKRCEQRVPVYYLGTKSRVTVKHGTSFTFAERSLYVNSRSAMCTWRVFGRRQIV